MNIDIITSTYNDLYKLSWKNNFLDNNFIIYHKNDILKNKEYIKHDNNNISIPNYGRCDYSFFWHIVNNYDKLADYNIFTKINWKEQNINLEELVKKCFKYDFCDVGVLPEYHIWASNTEEANEIKNQINHENIAVNLFSDCAVKSNRYIWYKKIFNNSKFPNPIILWGHGPCFSVSKKLIYRHPIHVYEYFLNLFEINCSNELESKIYHDELQRFWKILFCHEIDESKFKIEYH